MSLKIFSFFEFGLLQGEKAGQSWTKTGKRVNYLLLIFCFKYWFYVKEISILTWFGLVTITLDIALNIRHEALLVTLDIRQL